MPNRLLSAPSCVRSALFAEFLQGVPNAASAPEAALALSKLAQPMRIGRACTAPLDVGRDLLVYIGEGATKLTANTSSGREQIVAFHFSGDLVSIPSSAWHSYNLCGLAEAEILVFPTEEFLQAAGGEPIFLSALLQRSLTALHRSRDKAVGLGRKNAQQRLASFLVGMEGRIGLTKGGSCVLDLPMSRRDIGDSLGLTIETVSRQFSELRAAGLIETMGRSQVTVKDVAVLAERGGHG